MKEDRIISTLVGLAGACSNNGKTENTDLLVLRALAFPLLCPNYDEEELCRIVDEIYSEKKTIAPNCFECMNPCGNTSDYDMNRIYEAEEGIREVKLQILEKIRKMAFYVFNKYESEMDIDFFYKALLYIGNDISEENLHHLLSKAEKMEQEIQAGGI